MPNLFLIDGIAGSGKSELISHCSQDSESVFITKYTTKSRDTDGIPRDDLSYVDADTFSEIKTRDDFVYSYPKYDKKTKYMIKKSELDDNLRNHDNVFVIVRSSEIIKEIKERYSKYVNIHVVSIFIYCDDRNLIKRTKKQLLEARPDISQEELDEKLKVRLSRNEECLESYIHSLQENNKIYDYVIINDLDLRKYYSSIDKIVNKYVKSSKNFSDLSAFVIMPMPTRHEAAHFYNVKEAICSGAENAGFKAERADDVFANEKPIISRIKEYIKNATVCIVDLTNNRPNCYFEAGLSFEKNSSNIPSTFFIAEQGTKIEFDLNGNERKEYTYSLKDYSNVTNIVESILINFKREHIFECSTKKADRSKRKTDRSTRKRKNQQSDT